MPSEIITLEGHIIDSRLLPKVLDEVIDHSASYEIVDLSIGVKHDDTSFARIRIETDTDDLLLLLLDRLQQHGANREKVDDVRLEEADVDGAFPTGFYSSTNLDTEIRVDGKWIPVERTEMDCGIVYEAGRARTIAMADVRKGLNVVMAGHGIRVTPLEKPRGEERQTFEFMSSDISSEKPKSLMIDRVAQQMREVKAAGKRIMWVAGPALVH
ncbi:MAG: TIGR00300 family protein, partial [Actinomycetota bacterium]